MRALGVLLSLVLTVSSIAVPAPPAPGAQMAPMRSPLVSVQVVNPFQAPANRYAAGHRGVDLAAAVGVDVRAPAAGEVVYAGRLVDRGVISIEHAGGVRSSFEPVTALVSVGQQVAAGEVVGEVQPGHARCAPVSCLHWGVRVNGEYVDPMMLLAPLQVRLLPWDG